MKATQLYTARHLLAGICGLIGMVLLAIGAHAALDLHASDAAKAVSTEESASAIQLALIIGMRRGTGTMLPQDGHQPFFWVSVSAR
jgi:uncharacterized membrane protein YbhN (UPF0104 family)